MRPGEAGSDGASNILKRREKRETGLADSVRSREVRPGLVGWPRIKGEGKGSEDVSRKSCHGWMSDALGGCGQQGVGQGDAV